VALTTNVGSTTVIKPTIQLRPTGGAGDGDAAATDDTTGEGTMLELWGAPAPIELHPAVVQTNKFGYVVGAAWKSAT
jgi:hypothetical protein